VTDCDNLYTTVINKGLIIRGGRHGRQKPLHLSKADIFCTVDLIFNPLNLLKIGLYTVFAEVTTKR